MPRRILSPQGPDRDAALAQYRRRAGVYDRELTLFEHVRRVARARWASVAPICSPVETADIRVSADAALFHFTHDILRRREAIANVIRHLKQRLGRMNVESRLFGAAYVASGVLIRRQDQRTVMLD